MKMADSKYTSVRYCPHLGHNVIIEQRIRGGVVCLECLNRADCGYSEEGCRNRLIEDRRLEDRS